MQRNAIIIEDDAASASLIKIILNLEGFASTIHPKGIGALHLIHKMKPEIVVLDLGLPDIHGADVCRMILNQPENQFVKVVLFTAETRNIESLAASCGAIGVLSKALTPSQLKSQLHVLLAQWTDALALCG
jgi:DNA-binding response OmpR family regulator